MTAPLNIPDGLPAHLKAIVFDFDGTILDTETTEFRRWEALYRQHNRNLALTDWQRGIGTWGAFDPWAGLPEHVQADRENVHATLHQSILSAIQEQELRPGVLDVFREIKAAGLRLALASSSDRAWITRWLTQHKLLDVFETLATRDDVTRVKPDPELYQLAARNLDLKPEQCLAVEDSLNGATAAIAAGMHLIVVPNDVTKSQPFPPEWTRLDDGYAQGLAGLLKAVK